MNNFIEVTEDKKDGKGKKILLNTSFIYCVEPAEKGEGCTVLLDCIHERSMRSYELTNSCEEVKLLLPALK